MEGRGATSGTKVNRSSTDMAFSCLTRPCRSRVLKKEECRYAFKAAFDCPIYPSVSPRKNAVRRYSHSEGLSQKTTTSPGPESLSTVVKDPADEKFNWFKNWWVVQLVDNLETDRPNKIQLLNKDFIVWKGHSGEWIVMDDECPHRMAPLSEGRIEDDGNLLCSYHAWRFNESGKCVKIPHAEDEKAHSVACNSPRSAVQTYPCKTRGSLFWIWPDNSASAFGDSAQKPLPMDDDLADFYENHARDLGFLPFLRFVPYSYDVLMEELADPARMQVSYHGLIPGFKRYNAAPMNMEEASAVGDKEIIGAVSFSNPPMSPWVHYEIRPPGLISAHSKDDKGQPLGKDSVFITPLSPGKSMVIMVPVAMRMIANPPKANPFMKPFLAWKAAWLQVSFVNKLYDSNAVLLHEQDKKIKLAGSKFVAKEDYFAPVKEDTLVMAFRRWFETVGERGAAFGGDQPIETELSKEEILDRYEQYTKNCKASLQMLKDANSAVVVLKTVFCVSSLVVSVLLMKELSVGGMNIVPIFKNVKLMVSVLMSALSFYLFNVLEKRVIPLFYFVDHSYADMD